MLFLDELVISGNRFFFEWEITLMEWLQANLSPAVIGALSQLSMFGEELLLIVVMGFFYWCWNKEIGKSIGVNFLVAAVWFPLIKNIALRQRPYCCSENIDLLRPIDEDPNIFDLTKQGYSFPSGHSTSSAAVYGSAALSLRKKWATVLAFLLPLLVGVSRVVVGAHFPTDVLAGWALGALVIFLVPWLRKKIRNRWLFYGLIVLTALPGFFYCTSTDYYSSFGMLVGFLLAEPFEEKYVRFENTRDPLRIILRIAGGGAVYFGLNKVLKALFGVFALQDGSFAEHLARCGRYAIVIFVVIALYPMLFKYTAKIGAKKSANEVNPERL